MRFIRIKNNGLIEAQALHLVGASTKTNDSSKIGQFGSGNKYAMAYLLRNNYQLKVFSGKNEIKIETKESEFRNEKFQIIYIDGEKTSITTQMGKDWQFWQSLREIYCNAMDEGGYSMDFVSEIKPIENETHFYIKSDHKAIEFMTKFDDYFATKKDVLFECEVGRILKKTNDTANIYRKGIRCYETKKTSVYDYDFNEISIDENRLVNYFWSVEEKMWRLIFQCDNEEVIMNILHNCGDNEFIEGALSDISSINATSMSETFKNCIHSTNLAPKGFAGLLKADEVNQHVILPTKIFNSIRGTLEDDNVGDNFKVTKRGAFFREVEQNELQKETIRLALEFFKEVEFEVNFPIVLAIFEDKKVLGNAANGTIYLSDICVALGVNEVCNTIIEEFVHLKYDAKDETRDFQTMLIVEFIDYMKKKSAYAL